MEPISLSMAGTILVSMAVGAALAKLFKKKEAASDGKGAASGNTDGSAAA
ncbi:MAG: hypothetical protein HQL23_09210 [Candidatus Omnitrophica bacterium]|nr:hypothetical protein [Candidatus Omnitrophota bacterium]